MTCTTHRAHNQRPRSAANKDHTYDDDDDNNEQLSVHWNLLSKASNDYKSFQLFSNTVSIAPSPALGGLLGIKKATKNSEITSALFLTSVAGHIHCQKQEIDLHLCGQILRDKMDLLEREKDAKKYPFRSFYYTNFVLRIKIMKDAPKPVKGTKRQQPLNKVMVSKASNGKAVGNSIEKLPSLNTSGYKKRPSSSNNISLLRHATTCAPFVPSLLSVIPPSPGLVNVDTPDKGLSERTLTGTPIKHHLKQSTETPIKTPARKGVAPFRVSSATLNFAATPPTKSDVLNCKQSDHESGIIFKKKDLKIDECVVVSKAPVPKPEISCISHPQTCVDPRSFVDPTAAEASSLDTSSTSSSNGNLFNDRLDNDYHPKLKAFSRFTSELKDLQATLISEWNLLEDLLLHKKTKDFVQRKAQFEKTRLEFEEKLRRYDKDFEDLELLKGELSNLGSLNK